MTPTEQDDRTEALSSDLARQLRVAGDRVAVPDDGRTRVSGRVRARRARRRTQSVLGAFAVAVVLVGGVAVVRDRTGEEAAPVVAGPGPTYDLDFPVQPLAPVGVDWQIDTYRPPEVYEVDGEVVVNNFSYVETTFELSGVAWRMTVSSAEWAAIGDEGFRWVGDESGSTEQMHLVDGKEVTLRVDTADPTRVYQASWTDPSGDGISLVPAALTHMNLQRAGGSGPVSLAGSAQSLPTVDQALETAGRIRPVDDASWLAALMPPDGAVDARTGATVRPLRLGRPDELETMRISNLSPWTEIGVGLGQLAQPTSIFRLRSVALDSPGAGEPVEPPELERVAVAVRGVSGVYVSNMVNGTLTEFGHRLVWEEAGSRVEIWGSADHTTDDLVAFADSLVVLDDAQWEQVLLPGSGGRQSAGGELAEDPSGGLDEPVIADGLPRATPIGDVLPVMAPSRGSWSSADYAPASAEQQASYALRFEQQGRTWELLVGKTEMSKMMQDPQESAVHDNPVVDIDGRRVTLVPSATSGRYPAVEAEGAVHAAYWTDDRTGIEVLLSSLGPDTEDDYLDAEELSAVVETIEEVPVDRWAARFEEALDDLAGTVLASPDRLPSRFWFGESGVQMSFGSDDQPQVHLSFGEERPAGQPEATESVVVRGSDGLFGPWADASALGPWNRPQSVLEWQDQGSRVALELPSGVTAVDAVVMADALLAPSIDEWMVILGLV